jgi:PTS system mannose-specific IID component
VWLVWRPAAALLGVGLILAGAAWWVGAAAFLLAYNALHLWLRAWGVRVGMREGLQVARALRDAPFERLGERGRDAGAVLAGFAAVLMVGRFAVGPADYVLGAAAVAAGVLLGPRVRPVAALALLAVLAAGLIAG